MKQVKKPLPNRGHGPTPSEAARGAGAGTSAGPVIMMRPQVIRLKWYVSYLPYCIYASS